MPSNCTTICGDGIIAGTETCDDSNLENGDFNNYLTDFPQMMAVPPIARQNPIIYVQALLVHAIAILFITNFLL